MRVVVADTLPDSALDTLRRVSGWHVDARPGRSPDVLKHDLADADALIVRSATTVTRDLIDAAPRLRVIARAGTGVDNVDVQAATERGILVMNAPGANSVSVAELTLGLMLALSRGIALGDAAMKKSVWDKKRLTGAELRGKTLGIVGLGRIGQEVAARARPFGMEIVAHDPFLSEEVAARIGVPMLTLTELCSTSDYLTLHLPATSETRHLLNRDTLARCKRGMRIVNTARGELIDEGALADAIESGIIGGAALDVWEQEPPADWRLAGLPQVLATPHIAASTVEAQELVGSETVAAVKAFLLTGAITNAVNFPSVRGADAGRLEPFTRLAERMGMFLSQVVTGPVHGISIRYYGTVLGAGSTLISSAAIAGVLRPILLGGVSIVNARSVATGRGIEILESQSSRPRTPANVLSIKLQTRDGERWAEGTVFEPGSPRLISFEGVDIESGLDGTLLVIHNDDQPGVIGDVGTILGRHQINIATFGLGRVNGSAVGIVRIDAGDEPLERAAAELRTLPALRQVSVVRF